jgi:hypothetical protein
LPSASNVIHSTAAKEVPGTAEYKNSDELCKQMADRFNRTCLLRFGCGKDAIGAYIQLRRYFDRIIPVYHYLHPDLEFVNRSLEYYEKVFGCHIIRVPNHWLYKHLNSGLMQTKESWKIIQQYGLDDFDNDEVNEYIKEDLKLPTSLFTAVGVRASDNLNRGRSIRMHGAHNENRKTFFPVYDWNMERLLQEIKASGIKLPVDYKIWGKSFDGLDYRFIKPMRQHFPRDYEKLKELFPLLDVEIKRYEH